ncbi:MAG: hypothetical protein ACR2OG_05265 [Gemmatimonadaceae bacterium]
MTVPYKAQSASSESSASSPIAGSVLPTTHAEALLMTLPGVVAARIISSDHGAISEVHLLTTHDVSAKQTVRNVESALIAQLGIKVDHRKISVAMTSDTQRTADSRSGPVATAPVTPPAPVVVTKADWRRALYFEDVEVRRSRSKGVMCRVTLKKGSESFVGEAEGVESERSRAELAARAALLAIREVEGAGPALVMEGCKRIEAFDREFMFAAVTAREGRDSVLLTGSCEIRDSSETAAVLAVLDATNRWMGRLER